MSNIVTLQKWLLDLPYTYLADCKAGDLCEDVRLDILDLCLLRQALVTQNSRYLAVNAPVNTQNA